MLLWKASDRTPLWCLPGGVAHLEPSRAVVPSLAGCHASCGACAENARRQAGTL